MSNGKDAFKKRVKKKKTAHDWLMPPGEPVNNESEGEIINRNANHQEIKNENDNNIDSKNDSKNDIVIKDDLSSIFNILREDDGGEEETFESKYDQTNVYIERVIKAEIEKLIKDRKKKKKKLTKKDIYNNALRLYLKVKYKIDV